MVDGDDRDLGDQHDPALSRARCICAALTGATPAERSRCRALDGLAACFINAPISRLFRDAKKEPEERGADLGRAVQDR